jgi:hypothetical protein
MARKWVALHKWKFLKAAGKNWICPWLALRLARKERTCITRVFAVKGRPIEMQAISQKCTL